ncbi:SGNH/GDSL hydrolase family protein [Winogradskyella immobilis]|uniref:G-D-S-L family lipolytic protein n=1 Tax=Winogradskyella immobilis TaxID=2816852 RepID=A0ABS8EQA5_9FLAO|nr:G-D-S-L family lipolytic protein [Winogradskyella immobilis]MCC1485295.1 G-D-S-L family lipolytic protein [Winogradskyella immobilis]MCG0017387.1 G-D-S-L family lipolytic protein [Winogradskyella immobilis]
MKTKYIWLCLLFAAFTACSDDDDNIQVDPIPELTAGNADFSSFVSIGNSLTAGFTDNALFQAGQNNSFPNLLSQRFALVGGGNFNQPLTNDNIGGLLAGGNQLPGFNPRLFFDGSGPTTLPATPTTDIFSNNPTGPFNNMGVPGATSFQVVFNGLGNPAGLQTNPPTANPYFIRMATSPNSSMLEDAIAQNPSFVSLWIGNNDVLGFATSGGDENISNITPVPLFSASLDAIMSTMSGRQGVMANIPDVTTIPFFTTVPFAPLSPADPSFGSQIPTLNTIYGALNGVFAFLQSQGLTAAAGREVVFVTDAASPVVIVDETLVDLSAQITGVLLQNPTFPDFLAQFGLPAQAAPIVANLFGSTFGQTRQANADDLLTLTSASIIGTVNQTVAGSLVQQGLPPELAGQFAVEGITSPLADRFVLLPSEQQAISDATTTFNSMIESAATAAGFAFVDANSILSGDLTSGNFTLSTELVTGGAFSLDGVHPTARGYALIANEFMRSIDATYGSNFEASENFYDIGDFPTNYSPALQ